MSQLFLEFQCHQKFDIAQHKASRHPCYLPCEVLIHHFDRRYLLLAMWPDRPLRAPKVLALAEFDKQSSGGAAPAEF